jgi:hypothetical protein
MLNPGPKSAMRGAATNREHTGMRALSARRGFRSVSALAAVATTIALPLAAAGPASADQARQRQQWVLSALDVPAAWRLTHGRGVLVAVIDSGVDPSVSDLTGSVHTGPNYTGVKTSPKNPNWGVHGTWMASLIAGHGHGRGARDGVLGVAPAAKILSIRVITDHTDPGYHAYYTESESRVQRELAKAINFAVRRGAQVISMSLGYNAWSLGVRSALQYALSHGVVVVASSGNAGTTHSRQRHSVAPYSFPADYPGVIGVAAVTQAGQPAYFSSENLSVQVAAPGVNVPAQGRGSKYWVVSGTSPACALTAGVAALIKSKYPKLTAAQVQTAITQSTSNRPRGGYNDQVGFGTVEAAAALRLAGRLARQVPGGQTRTGKVAASGKFGNGSAGVSAFPVRPRGRQKLLVFLGIGAGGLLLVVVALWVLVRGRRKRKAARVGRSAVPPGKRGPPVRRGRPVRRGPPVRPGLVSAAGPAGPAGPAAASGAGPDLRYPTQISPSQVQGHGMPVQGYIGQPGQGFPVQGYLGHPGQSQLGPGQYGQVQPGQSGPPGQATPGYAEQPGQPAPGYAGQPGQPAPGYAGQPGQPAPGYAGQPGQPIPGYAGQSGQPTPGYAGQSGQSAPGYADYSAAEYAGQPQPGALHTAPSLPGGTAPSQDIPSPPQADAGTSASSFSSQSFPGQTFLPQGGQAPGGQDNAGQHDSSESEWPFEDGPSEAAPSATTAPRLPIPPRPLEQRRDLVVPPSAARPTERDESDDQPEQRHGTVIPPARSLLPEPDDGRWLDDPLTSPRYSQDARRAGESGARGYRSDWLSRLEGVTRPTMSPQPTGQPAEQTPAAREAHEHEPGLGAPLEPERRSWAFDRSAAPSVKQDPIRPAEDPDKSPSDYVATSQPSEPAEPPMRSVWEPMTRQRPSSTRPGSDQTVEHPSPIARSGTWVSAAREAWLPQQPPAADSPAGQPMPGPVPRQSAPASAEPLPGHQPQPQTEPQPQAEAQPQAGPGWQAEPVRQAEPQPQAELGPQAESRSQAEPLPRRQPMTHLAAPLRRGRQSQPGRQPQRGWQPEAGPQHQADPAEHLPSVWDTWRPAAAAKGAAQADGSDPADDTPQ